MIIFIHKQDNSTQLRRTRNRLYIKARLKRLVAVEKTKNFKETKWKRKFASLWDHIDFDWSLPSTFESNYHCLWKGARPNPNGIKYTAEGPYQWEKKKKKKKDKTKHALTLTPTIQPKIQSWNQNSLRIINPKAIQNNKHITKWSIETYLLACSLVKAFGNKAQGRQKGEPVPKNQEITNKLQGRKRILKGKEEEEAETGTALCKLVNVISINHVNDRREED